MDPFAVCAGCGLEAVKDGVRWPDKAGESHGCCGRVAIECARTGSPLRAATTTDCTTMSLPRANYDPRRVCLNPFPNFTLPFTKHRRTIGVYLAGGLVSLRTPRPPLLSSSSASAHRAPAPTTVAAPMPPTLRRCCYHRRRPASSRSPSGRSSTPPCSPRTRARPPASRTAPRPCTSPSWTGCRGCARCWGCS